MTSKFVLFVMAALALTFSAPAKADSACWPEEKLVGTLAFSFIEGINSQLTRTDSGTCHVTLHVQPRDSSKGRIVPCQLLVCANGECGDGNEHTALAAIDRSSDFVKVELKDGSTAWLKVAAKTPSVEILHVTSEGTLFPGSTALLDAPNGAPLKFKIKDGVMLAFNVVKLLKVPTRQKGQEKMAHEVWAEVDAFPIESADPPIKLGAKIGRGYFLHRNAEGKVAAVLSAVSCD
jgi:hypothetical protein